MIPGSSISGGSSGAPPKYRMVYTPPGVRWADLNSSSIGATTHNITAVVQPGSYSTAAAGYHQAPTTASHQQFSMLLLWEGGSLCS
jgi:hypothetical protein